MKKSFWLYLLLCVLLLPAAAQAGTIFYIGVIGEYNDWSTDPDKIPYKVEWDDANKANTESDNANCNAYISNMDLGNYKNEFKVVKINKATKDVVAVFGNWPNYPKGSWLNINHIGDLNAISGSQNIDDIAVLSIADYSSDKVYKIGVNPWTSWAAIWESDKPDASQNKTFGLIGAYNNWSTNLEDITYKVTWTAADGNWNAQQGWNVLFPEFDPGMSQDGGQFRIVRFNAEGKIDAVYPGSNQQINANGNWDKSYGITETSSDVDNRYTINGYKQGNTYKFELNPHSDSAWACLTAVNEVFEGNYPTLYLGGNDFNSWSVTTESPKFILDESTGIYTLDVDLKGWSSEDENHYFCIFEGTDTEVGNTKWTTETMVNPGTYRAELKSTTGEAKSMRIGTDDTSYDLHARLVVDWKNRVNGNPVISIETGTRIYFVDRAGWGNLHCYNYTDRSISQAGEDVKFGDMNAKIPGVAMHLVTDETLKKGIAGNYNIYEVFLPGNIKEDGSYEYPKLLFSNGNTDSKKSRNLFLVNGGIYTNASSNNEITENEYRPRQFYNYWEDEKEVMAYPNIIHSAKTNVIYVDVPEFYKKAHDGGEVGIQIEYPVTDGEGNTTNFVATGVTGWHTLVPVEIDGHPFLRVEFAQDVIPNGTKVKLSIWEIDPANRDVYQYTDNSTKVSDINDPKLLEEKKSTDAVAHDSTNKDGEIGSHLYCHQSHCSLNFNNVIFQDGAVYSRSTTQQNIREIVQPDRFYIVNRGKTEDFDNTGLVADEASLEIYKQKFPETNAVAVYRVNRGEGYGDRLVYEVSDVTPATQLSFVAAFDIIENGVKTRTDWYTYAYANLGEAEENKKMLPGNHYRFWREHTGYYSIDTSNSPSANYYDIMVEWMNSTLYVTPVKVNADFRYGQKNEEKNTYSPVRNGYHVMYAVDDDSQEWEPVHIFHDPNYGLHDQVEVKMSRRQEWDKYFNNKLNLPAASENGLKPFEDSDATIGHSTANVRAYTSGICLVTVAQTVEDTQFHRSDLQVPVRVIPTPMSIGFTINFEGVRAAREGDAAGHFYMDRYTAENPADGDPFEYKDKNGTVFSPSRMGFFPQMAYTEKLDNEETMQLYWRYMTADEKNGYITAAYADEPVVAAETALDVNSDPYADVVANNNLLRYTADKSKHSSDAVDANGVKYQEVMTAENLKKAGGIVLQIKQNGINSPAYFVHLADDAIATDVEDIEAAEEAEAVYYDLNGMKVEADRLVKGVYVKVSGDKAEKIFVK